MIKIPSIQHVLWIFFFSWITNQTSIGEKNRYNASTGQFFFFFFFLSGRVSCWANGQHHFHHPSPLGSNIINHCPCPSSSRHVWPLPMRGVGRRDLWDGRSRNQHHHIGYAMSIESTFFSLTRMIDTTRANKQQQKNLPTGFRLTNRHARGRSGDLQHPVTLCNRRYAGH